MLKKIFHYESNTVLGGALIIGFFYLLNGFLALFRNALLASYFGASRNLDIYWAAFRIPDFIYVILISGALSAGFIPLFAEKLLKSREEAWQFANNILSTLIIILAFGAFLIVFFAPFFVSLIAPGFAKEEQKIMSLLVRIMMIQPVILGVSNLVVGMLQNFRRFLITSLAPIFYNLGIILGILLLVPFLGLKGLAWGVVLGAFLHLLIQLPSLKQLGFRFRFLPNFHSENLKRVLALAGPRVLGLISIQINFLIITIIASWLEKGSLAIFNFANDLQSFPQNIFAISFALASFPLLSQLINQKEEYSRMFEETFKNILIFMIPIAIFYFVFRSQLVRLTLGYGKFDWQAINQVIDVLAIFSFGIFIQSLLPFLVRSFFALQDALHPFLAGISANGLNVILSLILARKFGVEGLALAFVLATYFNFFLLCFFFKKKKLLFNWSKISSYFLKIFLLASIAGFIGWGFLKFFSLIFVSGKILALFFQTFLSLLMATGAYLLCLFIFVRSEFERIRTSLPFLKSFRANH